MFIKKMKTPMQAYLIALALVAAVFQQACTKSNMGADDPKGRLKSYIERTFNVRGVEDKKELLSYLSGDAKTRLSAWSDEQFRQAFIESKRQFVKLSFRETKAVSPSEVSVTYELTYVDKNKASEAKVTQRKLAQMSLVDSKWVIHDVKNVKELVEYQNEMSLP